MKLSSQLLFIEPTKSIVSMSAYERKYELKETDYVHVNVSNFQGRKSHGSWWSTHTHIFRSHLPLPRLSVCLIMFLSLSPPLLAF